MPPSTPLVSEASPADPAPTGQSGDTERPRPASSPDPFPQPPSGLRAPIVAPPPQPIRHPSSSRLPAVRPPPSQPRLPGATPSQDTTPLSAGSVAIAPTAALQALTRRCATCNERYPADFLVCPRDASPLSDEATDAVDPMVGKLLGETYQIVRVVGEGGMGRVYEARHLRLKERRFAVKMLHAELARNAEMASRFLREAESASSLSHPHVVDVFDVHHMPEGTPYFVGEFLEGEELADHVKTRSPLDARAAAAVGRQICSALAAAHARGIVHRDLKPENVFVIRPGDPKSLTVKVLDFGISKVGGKDRTHLTRTGVIMGTPSYMSPEQARGQDVDARADVYSLGATLYFALTGTRPFDSDDPTATVSMVLTRDPMRLRTLDPRIPEGLELIVQKAMAKDAADRFQTMAELDKALAGFEDGLRGVPGVASVPPPALPGHSESALDIARHVFAAPGAANAARLARPTIAIASAVLGLWLVGGATAALAGLVRVLHAGEVTLTESVLLVVGCLFAAATPIALYVFHVQKNIWPNSVRAVQLAADVQRTAVTALVSYGALSIIGRIVHTVLFRSSGGLSSGAWDIALFVTSALAAATIGGFGPLLRNMSRKKRR